MPVSRGFFGIACGEPQNDGFFPLFGFSPALFSLSSLSGLTGQSKISRLLSMFVVAQWDSRSESGMTLFFGGDSSVVSSPSE